MSDTSNRHPGNAFGNRANWLARVERTRFAWLAELHDRYLGNPTAEALELLEIAKQRWLEARLAAHFNEAHSQDDKLVDSSNDRQTSRPPSVMASE
jgi:hypothetical protein